MSAVDDDPFDAIINGLEIQSVDIEDVVNVQTLSDLELIDMRDDITDAIMKAKGLFKNNTDWQRDQHSLRAAIIVELSRRGLS